MNEESKEKKKQHWLPASYLQFFTIDPKEQNRGGYLYRVDKSGYKKVKVETQGVSSYHYRRLKTHQSEGLFRIFESDYPELIRKAVAAQPLSVEEQCKIVLSIITLYCRNPFITNQTGWENWDVFVSISNSFLENHLGAPPQTEAQELNLRSLADGIIRAQQKNPLPLNGIPSDDEFLRMAYILHFVGSTFRVAFIRNLGGEGPLYTSDFPTLFFSLDRMTVFLLLLPVTPSLLAVAYDTRFFEVRHSWLSSEDLQLIQVFLHIQTDKAFFVGAIHEDDLRILSEALQNRTQRSEGWVKPDVWQPIMYPYYELLEQKGGFDFFALRE